jgi:hypothetical protein
MKLARLPLLALLALPALAIFANADAGKGHAKQVRYVGPHPIPKQYGGGVCHIEVPHVHVYVPADVKVQYRKVDDAYYFVGDPVAYGWDGPKYVYEGHHPIAVGEVVYDDDDGDDGDVEYCYIDGPHYHYYAPPEGVQFELKGDAYWYTGTFPQAYLDARPVYDPIDVVYEPMHYERPVVEVEPPIAWVGFQAGVVAPVAVVEGPHGHAHVEAAVVAPSLEVEIGVPAIVVGGGVIVEGHEHHHHDNGWHKGWHKRGHGRGKWHW